MYRYYMYKYIHLAEFVAQPSYRVQAKKCSGLDVLVGAGG